MTPDKERLLQDRCICFKRILAENRLYVIIQCLLDGFLIYTVAVQLIVGRSLAGMAVIGAVMVKLALVFLLKGNKGCLAGLAVSVLYLPLMAALKMLEAETIGVTVLIIAAHVFRIVPCAVAGRISGLYGAPGFNGFILSQELKTDESLQRSVLGSYNEVSNDMVVGNSVKESMLPRLIRAMRPLGILVLTVGICMMVSARGLSRDIENSKAVTIGEKSVGKTVSEVTDLIYANTLSGDAGGWWCRVGEQCVNVIAYGDESKDKFSKLCIACGASSDALAGELIGAEHESSSEPVKFIARVKKYDRNDALRPGSKMKQNIQIDTEFCEDYYLEVIEPETVTLRMNMGAVISV